MYPAQPQPEGPPIMQVQIPLQNDQQYVKGTPVDPSQLSNPMVGIPQQSVYTPQMQYPPINQQPQYPYQFQQPPPPPPPQQFYGGMPPVMINQDLRVQQKSSYPPSADGVPFSAKVRCPNCKKDITTIVHDRIGSGTWCCCLIFTCIIPVCFWVPFVSSKCKDKVHHCPNCDSHVGYCEYKVL